MPPTCASSVPSAPCGATGALAQSGVGPRATLLARGHQTTAGQRDSANPQAPTCSINQAQTCSIKREGSIAVTAVHRALGE